MQCMGITSRGTRCKGVVALGATPDASYCYSHDPARASERRRNAQRAGRIGGNGRGGGAAGELADVKMRLSDLAEDVLQGSVDKSVGSVVSQILNVYLRAIGTELQVREQTELVERLDALEAEESWDAS
jgi:hypothetical protein